MNEVSVKRFRLDPCSSSFSSLEEAFTIFEEYGYAGEATHIAEVLDAAATDLENYNLAVNHTVEKLTRASLVARLRNMAALFRTPIHT